MSLGDFLFPKRCSGCGKVGDYFCPGCIKEIGQGELICPVCEKMSIGGLVHPLCQRKYSLDGLWSLGVYQGSLKKAIQKLKYRFVAEIGETLADLIIGYWAQYQTQVLDEIKKDPDSWVIIPVPLHPKREKWRGFNQSALLGRILASKLGLQYQEILKRIKQTKPQVNLKSSQRKQNIKNAFILSPNSRLRQPKAGPPMAETPNYLLVDDVWTTGSTLKECCYVLKRSGAGKVWALTLAR